LDSSEEAVRAQALRTLGALGDKDDLRRLADAMQDPSPWAALYAARGLRAAGGGDVLTEIAASDRPTAELARQILAEGVSR
jgi:HEAT repeat protein